GVDVPVNALPASESGAVTFGSLNNFCKINERVLALWSRVLGRVEGSRLMILSPTGSHRERMLALLDQFGVDASRVEFVAPRPRREVRCEAERRVGRCGEGGAGVRQMRPLLQGMWSGEDCVRRFHWGGFSCAECGRCAYGRVADRRLPSVSMHGSRGARGLPD